ncbi:MAG: hypothetical protein Q9160_007253 [Pyrenula sp. 1 TL-2023]
MASSSSSDNFNADSHRQFHQATFAGLGNLGEQLREAEEPQFDIFQWYPRYISCQKYFLDHAQYEMPVQALTSFIKQPNPVHSSAGVLAPPLGGVSSHRGQGHRFQSPSSPGASSTPSVSLIPYLRRLVATGMDFPGVLHGFFGDDWAAGIGPLHEQERRNYLFAAKSGGWAAVKQAYDLPPLETVPFLRPLQGAAEVEIQAAERNWSEWLAMEDWMVGPRAPQSFDQNVGSTASRHAR